MTTKTESAIGEAAAFRPVMDEKAYKLVVHLKGFEAHIGGKENAKQFRDEMKMLLDMIKNPPYLRQETAAVGDAELVDLMLKGARLSKDKTSNRANMHGALNAIRDHLRQASPAQGGVEGLRRIIAGVYWDGHNSSINEALSREEYIQHICEQGYGFEEPIQDIAAMHTTDAPLITGDAAIRKDAEPGKSGVNSSPTNPCPVHGQSAVYAGCQGCIDAAIPSTPPTPAVQGYFINAPTLLEIMEAMAEAERFQIQDEVSKLLRPAMAKIVAAMANSGL